MKKILVALSIVFIMAGVCNAYLPIDISGSQYETKSTDTMRVRNVTVPGFAGKYWLDFQWSPSSLVFVPVNVGIEPTVVDPILAKTELLKGSWRFVYTISTSTFTQEYTLSNINGATNSEGGYYIYGINDKSGSTVLACYWPDSGNWSLLDRTSSFDRFYYFFTDGNSILSNSCYFQVVNGSMSSCYKLTGTKTNDQFESAYIYQNEEKELSAEKENYSMTTDALIVEMYWSMKDMIK